MSSIAHHVFPVRRLLVQVWNVCLHYHRKLRHVLVRLIFSINLLLCKYLLTSSRRHSPLTLLHLPLLSTWSQGLLSCPAPLCLMNRILATTHSRQRWRRPNLTKKTCNQHVLKKSTDAFIFTCHVEHDYDVFHFLFDFSQHTRPVLFVCCNIFLCEFVYLSSISWMYHRMPLCKSITVHS